MTTSSKITSLAVAAFVALAPAVAYASSMSLAPASVKTAVGRSFTMTVSVDPAGTPIYTVKSRITFPADLLEVRSFKLGAGSWISITQPGYDVIDNTAGILIKSAGWPKGLSAKATLGTITFKVKKAGTGQVAMTTGSALYDRNSANVFSGGNSVTVTIAEATPTPTPSATASATVEPTPSAIPSATPEDLTPNAEDETVDLGNSFLAASLINTLSFGTGMAWLGWLVFAIIIIVLAVIVRKIITRPPSAGPGTYRQ